MPPLIFETIGFWIELPPGLPRAYTERGLHFMGGIHATEHAAIGLFPLLAIADRNDIGGISYTGHPQIAGPAIFIYDGVPGGAGLAEQGFTEVRRLLPRTLQLESRSLTFSSVCSRLILLSRSCLLSTPRPKNSSSSG